ncbi:MAG: hypothetical protein AAB668_03320 [Patescibacteria group bacterium]
MKKIEISLVAMVVASIVIGCEGFGPPPGSESDAGVMPDDDGARPRVETDGGMQMPPETDAGEPLGDVPSSGESCDPDRDVETYDCAREGCDRAYLVCLGNARWACVPDVGAICAPTPRPETDAGTPSVGTDAGPLVTVTDAGSITSPSDAGPLDYCVPGSFVGCWLACGYPGHIDCNPATGRYDANGGACRPFAGLECPAPRPDAGTPAPIDAGTDSGPPPVDAGHDAGSDAGSDAGTDAGTDAGPSWTPTGRLRVRVNTSSLAEIGAWCPEGGAPDIRLHDGSRWRTSCRASTLDVPTSAVGLGPYNATVFCQRDTACPSSGEPSWDGYFSPRIIGATLNSRVSTSHFVEVNYDGRPIQTGTFYCWDIWSRGSTAFRRFQVQIVAPSASLPSGCYGSSGS